MRLALSLILTLCLAQCASASIVFSLIQDPSTPGPIVLGSTAVFTVQISSDSGTINNLAGVDFVIEADDPLFTGTAIAGGQFISGTNDLFGPLGGFVLAFPSSFQVFGANAGTGLTITAEPTTVARLTLSTAGATAGDYTMNLSSLLAVDPGFDALSIVAAAPLAYTIITAVPEPSSLALVGLAITLTCTRRRKSKVAAATNIS
jgi:hypothetical protein